MKIITEKHCSRCDTTKPVSEFYTDRAARGGLRAYCKPCDRASAASHQQAHPAQTMRSMAAHRARHRNLPCTITVEDVQRLIDAAAFDGHPFGVCPVFGYRMSWRERSGSGGGPDSVTLDCVVPELGYVPDNIVLLSKLANTAKSDVSTSSLIRAAAYMSADSPPVQADEVDTGDSRTWRGTTWRSRMVPSARARGKRPFGFPRSELALHVKRPRECPCCGVELSYAQGVGKGNPRQASIDCFDASDTVYLPGRFATVCMSCNVVMQNLDSAELFAVAEWLSFELTSRGHQLPHEGALLFDRHGCWDLNLAA